MFKDCKNSEIVTVVHKRTGSEQTFKCIRKDRRSPLFVDVTIIFGNYYSISHMNTNFTLIEPKNKKG